MILTENILRKNDIKPLDIDEVFTQVKGWSKYFVSNYGRLVHKNNKGRYTIVKPSIAKGGYLTYTLSKPARTYRGEKVRTKDGTPKSKRFCTTAQQLVAIMYIDNTYPDNYRIEDLQIHHKDKNRTNNYYKNLMYLSTEHHGFIHTIRKIAVYNQNKGQYHTYRDIEVLATRVQLDAWELLDTLKNTTRLFKDGKWNIYNINGVFIGVEYMVEKKAENKNADRNKHKRK